MVLKWEESNGQTKYQLQLSRIALLKLYYPLITVVINDRLIFYCTYFVKIYIISKKEP